jgi:hypothetical protein
VGAKDWNNGTKQYLLVSCRFQEKVINKIVKE